MCDQPVLASVSCPLFPSLGWVVCLPASCCSGISVYLFSCPCRLVWHMGLFLNMGIGPLWQKFPCWLFLKYQATWGPHATGETPNMGHRFLRETFGLLLKGHQHETNHFGGFLFKDPKTNISNRFPFNPIGDNQQYSFQHNHLLPSGCVFL